MRGLLGSSSSCSNPTAFGLAKLNPRSNSRDLKGVSRVHGAHWNHGLRYRGFRTSRDWCGCAVIVIPCASELQLENSPLPVPRTTRRCRLGSRCAVCLAAFVRHTVGTSQRPESYSRHIAFAALGKGACGDSSLLRQVPLDLWRASSMEGRLGVDQVSIHIGCFGSME